jgi:hypothetical protein
MRGEIGVKVKNVTELVELFFTSGEQTQTISNTRLYQTPNSTDTTLEIWLYQTRIARISKDGKLYITYGNYDASSTSTKRLWAILSDSSLNLSREKIGYYTKLARTNQPNEVEIIEYKK